MRACGEMPINQPSPGSDPHCRGVTLTEVVVASGLLLIAVVPVLRALTIAQITDRVIERKTRSLTLAQRELERIRAASMYHYDDSFAETSRAHAVFQCRVLLSLFSGLRPGTIVRSRSCHAEMRVNEP